MLVLLSSHSLQTVFSQHLQTPLWTRKVYVGVALAMVRNPRTMLLLPYVPVSLQLLLLDMSCHGPLTLLSTGCI